MDNGIIESFEVFQKLFGLKVAFADYLGDVAGVVIFEVNFAARDFFDHLANVSAYRSCLRVRHYAFRTQNLGYKG